MPGEIGLERNSEGFGPGLLDDLPIFGIRGRELDPPSGSAANKCAIQDKTCEMGPPQRTGCKQRDDQSVAKGQRALARGILSFRANHQIDAELKQLAGRNQPPALWPSRPVSSLDLR